MSWVKEEWKDGLPGNVMANISELEDDCERLAKEKKALQFQVDSLQASLDKSRAAEEDANKQKRDAERTLASFMSELDEVKMALEKSRQGSREKDVTILNLTNEVAKNKREKELEKERRLEMERDNEKLNKELCDKDQQLEEVAKQLNELQHLNGARNSAELLGKSDSQPIRSKSQRFSEETFLIDDERDLEKNESWVIEKQFDEADVDDLKSQVETLQQKLLLKDEETQGLYAKIEELDTLLDANTPSKDLNKDSASSLQAESNVDDSENETKEFAQKISVMKSQIFELEQENEDLRAAVSDQRTRTLSAERISEYAVESLRESLTELNAHLVQSEKAREDIARQLREEREMFMVSENELRQEIKCLNEEFRKSKKEWQEEREEFLEEERRLNCELQQLKCDGRMYVNEDKLTNNECNTIALETEISSLNKAICILQTKNDSLESSKFELEKEKENLVAEIRREKDHCSDVEETMKDDIDSIRSCLEGKIDHLERQNKDLEMKLKEQRNEDKNSHYLQTQVDELCNELDEVNKILADERNKRKELEAASLEFKKKERAYENVIAANVEGDDKSVLTSFLNKRCERWNDDVVELRKKVDELEKKNRELTNALDRRTGSVEALKQGYESKLKGDQLKKGSRIFATPERSAPSSEMLSRSSSYNTPISRGSSLHATASESRTSVYCDQRSKAETIAQLKAKIAIIEDEKEEQAKVSNSKVQALEDEISILKQHIQGMPAEIKSGAPNTVITPKAFNSKINQEIQTSSINDKGKRSVLGNSEQLNSVEELKALVTEFECESSELQEIIDESKEAIFELKKALQGNDGLFLVDSANMEEIKKLASLSRIDFDEADNLQRPNWQEKNDFPLEKQSHEKQSYILSRLSLTDIDVESVLSKLRIAISQLEARLETVNSEKEQAQAKIRKIKKNASKICHASNLNSKSAEELVVKTSSRCGLQSSRSAVIDIARERDAVITDGTIDDIAHEQNLRPRDGDNFQHGVRCRLLWQQLCDVKASLSGYEREMARQKKIHEKEIAEIHEKESLAKQEEVLLQQEEKIDKEELDKKEQVIRSLESQLLDEKQSSLVLHEEIESCRAQLDESNEKNCRLGEKLEETRALLYKHHKSNDKKLDVLTNYVQEGLIEEVKRLLEVDCSRRVEYVRASPSEQRYMGYSGANSKHSSYNTSFHSPEENIQAEIAVKKSRSRRNKGLETHRSATARGYHMIDEIEGIKGHMSSVQDNVKGLLACIEQMHRDKCKLQDECKYLLKRIEDKDEELKRYDANMESEKQRMSDIDTEYRAELDALKAEQLEVFQEFREMCEAVKRKDLELLNKSKQMKLLSAEWKEKEATLDVKIDNLEKENKVVWTENNELRVEVERSKNIKEEYTRKMKNAEDNLNNLYQKLSHVDSIFYECKQKGLYK